MKIDVSVVLNLHREAVYLGATLRSLDACAVEAQKRAINVELIVVFDRSDTATREAFAAVDLLGFSWIQSANVDFGSLGLARNYGIELASGEYIWTADGDDLSSKNAIVELYDASRCVNNSKVVAFAEYLVAFGDRFHVARYFGSEHLTAADFAYTHPFVSRIFIHRDAFSKMQFNDLRLGIGFAYEDWDFNNRLYADGYKFITAKDTIFFYRQRGNSLVSQANSLSAKIPPDSKLFNLNHFRTLMREFRSKVRDWNEFVSQRSGLWHRNNLTELLSSPKLLNFIGEVAYIDPEVEVDRIQASFSVTNIPYDCKHWGFDLEKLYNLVGCDGFTDILIVPWLRPGGAEKYILQVLDELCQLGFCRKLLVFAGERADKHEWKSRLPAGSVFIDLFNTFPVLDDDARTALASRAILGLAAKGARLHLKTSKFAHQLVSQYGAVLSKHTQTVYYRFCDDSFLWFDRRVDVAFGTKMLRKHLNEIDVIISDCSYIAEKDERIIGKSVSVKQNVLYAKCAAVESIVNVDDKPKKRFLWASRISTQKRPELLPMIMRALRMQYSDISIDVFGAIEKPFDRSFFFEQGLYYKGPFQSFSELQIGAYDALIYTSAFDGMPNVVLESMGNGLIVIGPKIGGIGEVIQNYSTGFLVDDSPNDSRLVENYLSAIANLYGNWENINNYRENAVRVVRSQHGDNQFSTKIREIFAQRKSLGD